MSEDYVREQVAAAVEALATSSAAIQKRLRSAFMAGLFKLEPEDFVDAESRAKFGAIMEQLTTQTDLADPTEGAVAATVEGLSDDQAQKLAQAIVDLDHQLRPVYS